MRNVDFMLTKAIPVLLMLTLMTLGCAGRSSGLQDQNYLTQAGFEVNEESKPKIILVAEPIAGFAPLRVTFRAVLQNVAPDKQQQFGCQWEEWSFGDGRVSAQRRNCNFSAASQIETEFWAEHLYSSDGAFSVRFKIGDQLIQSNAVLVRVLSRSNMDSAFSTIR